MKNLQSVDVDVLSEKSYDLTIVLINKFQDIILSKVSVDFKDHVLDKILKYVDSYAFSHTISLFSSHLKKDDGIPFNIKLKVMLNLLERFNISDTLLFSSTTTISTVSNEIAKIDKNLASAFSHDTNFHLSSRTIRGFIENDFIKVFEDHIESSIILAHENNEEFTFNGEITQKLDSIEFKNQVIHALLNFWFNEKIKELNKRIENRILSLKSIYI